MFSIIPRSILINDIINYLNPFLLKRVKIIVFHNMFSAFDADSDGSINGPELHHGIRDMVGDILSPAQISVIIQSLDVNEDHRIGLDELRQALSEEE